MLHNSQIAKRKIGEDINVSSELVVLQVAAQHNNTRKFMALDQYSTIMNQKIHVLHFLHASQWLKALRKFTGHWIERDIPGG